MNEFSESVHSIGIVEDHPLMTEALRATLERSPGFRIAWLADLPAQAKALVKFTPPDLIIMDLAYLGESGLELLHFITEHHPRIAVMVYSAMEETTFAERCIRMGAKGYLMKVGGSAILLAAIRKILAGGIYLSDSMSDRLLGEFNAAGSSRMVGLNQLSNCEMEVFNLLGQGLSPTQIADSLSRSRKTIETFQFRIRRKLNLQGSRALSQFAMARYTHRHADQEVKLPAATMLEAAPTGQPDSSRAPSDPVRAASGPGQLPNKQITVFH